MGTKKMKKTAAVIIATATVCGMTAGCTPKEEKIEVNASTSQIGRASCRERV